MRRCCLATAIAVGICTAVAGARAQETTKSTDPGGWSFAVAPYIWAAGLEGNVATLPPAPPADVDMSFRDIVDNLDLAFMGIGEVRKGRFALVVDLVYTELSAGAETPGPFFSNGELEQKTFVGTFQGSYRVVAEERGELDLLAGARVWSVETKLTLNAGLLPAQRRDDNETWVDPVIGVRGRVNLGARFYLTGMANVGGFGAASDITWDVFGAVGYQLTHWFAPVIGYRYLAVDYEKDGFLFDVAMSGPLIGGVIRF